MLAAVEVADVEEAGAEEVVVGAVQVPRVPVEGSPLQPELRVPRVTVRLPGPAQVVPRKLPLLSGLRVQPPAQKPGPGPGPQRQGKLPQADSVQALRAGDSETRCRCRGSSLDGPAK